MLTPWPILLAVLGGAPANADAAPVRMLVMPVQARSGVSPDAAEVLSALVISELQRRPDVVVVSTRDVENVLGVERQKQLLDCDGEGCVTDIADALRVDQLVTGTATRVGALYVVSLGRVRMRDAITVNAVSAQQTGDDESVLPPLVPSLVEALMKDARAGSAQGAVTPDTRFQKRRPTAAAPSPGAEKRTQDAPSTRANRRPLPRRARDDVPREGDGSGNRRPGVVLLSSAAAGAVLAGALLVVAAACAVTVAGMWATLPRTTALQGLSLGVPLTVVFVAAQVVLPVALLLSLLGMPASLVLATAGAVMVFR